MRQHIQTPKAMPYLTFLITNYELTLIYTLTAIAIKKGDISNVPFLLINNLAFNYTELRCFSTTA
ncbi:hypothetical protein NIES21_01800 [Anabaenopsis circularis NIES-21]|uniref:Uncharacterized protein n=1 Tax=Anabaenopsis circularis NIES-21 TaxID=1085406 RepID=A0A1Z4GA78_9CYAN|nr:hypothetical protein NIES21_01800 [Anabaenopsis circularis NIES-21]